MLLFYAFTTGKLERLGEDGIKLCLLGLGGHMSADIKALLHGTSTLSPPNLAKLSAALDEVLRPYVHPHTKDFGVRVHSGDSQNENSKSTAG